MNPSYPQPPSCNTGVATPPEPQGEPITPATGSPIPPTYTLALDYLSCHIEADVQTVCEGLADYLGVEVKISNPMHGYTHGIQLTAGDEVYARIFYSIGGHPFLQAAGSDAQLVEDAINAKGWAYRVTRKDVALDLYDASWFPILTAAGKAYAEAGTPPMKIEYAGDWHYGKKGRTLYLGARTSRYFFRLYEKGRKEKADPNWIRAEVQINPQSEAEQRYATQCTPGQLWCLRASAVWGKALGLSLDELFEYPTDRQARPRRDTERARRALAMQYGPTLQNWIRDCGGDPVSFVAELLHTVEHQRQVRNWREGPSVNVQELKL